MQSLGDDENHQACIQELPFEILGEFNGSKINTGCKSDEPDGDDGTKKQIQNYLKVYF